MACTVVGADGVDGGDEAEEGVGGRVDRREEGDEVVPERALHDALDRVHRVLRKRRRCQELVVDVVDVAPRPGRVQQLHSPSMHPA